MRTFALDTNIISYLLKDDDTVFAHYTREIRNGSNCVIPPVVYYEVKRGLLSCNATAKTRLFENFCRDFSVGRMTTAMWDEAARLYAWHRRNGTMVEDADLFIAAFCIVNDYVLVTHNTKHFAGIEGLQSIDWK